MTREAAFTGLLEVCVRIEDAEGARVVELGVDAEFDVELGDGVGEEDNTDEVERIELGVVVDNVDAVVI